MLCSSRGVSATRRRETAQQAGKAMLVNVMGGVFVTHVLAHDRVVQAACLGPRTVRAMWVPMIMGIFSLRQRELLLKYVPHCYLEA